MTISLEKLTHKNQEFIHIATKQLIADGKTDAQIKEYIKEIYPVLLENQAKGITARSLFGSPTAWAASKTISSKEEASTIKKENDDPKLMIMDQILLIFGFFAILNGAMGLFSPSARTYGILTILAFSLFAGLAFYALYYLVYRHTPSTRPPFWKSALIIAGITLLWIVLVMATGFLPSAINPLVPNLPLLIVGAVVLALRFYLKKRFNIKNAMKTS